MPVMAVNNEDQHEQAGDYRSRPRWSAGKKMEAVLRLLRGEPLEVLSRELGVEAHRLAAWCDDFLEGGKDALKGQRPDWSGDDRALRQAERKVGQLTMENGVLRAAAENGAVDPAGEAAQIAMQSQLPVAVVCRVLGAPAPAWTPAGSRPVPSPTRPGDLDQRPRPGGADPPGPGCRTLRWGGVPQGPGSAASRARRPGSGNRPLRLLRQEGLLAQRVRGRRKPRPHDGTIIPDRPNLRWAPTRPWPGPAATAGCGGSAWSITTPPRRGRTWPRSRTLRRPAAGL